VLVGEHDRAYIEGTEILEKVDTLYIHRNFDVQTFKNDDGNIRKNKKIPQKRNSSNSN
jgi:hypothetical protein